MFRSAAGGQLRCYLTALCSTGLFPVLAEMGFDHRKVEIANFQKVGFVVTTR